MELVDKSCAKWRVKKFILTGRIKMRSLPLLSELFEDNTVSMAAWLKNSFATDGTLLEPTLSFDWRNPGHLIHKSSFHQTVQWCFLKIMYYKLRSEATH